MKRLCSRAVVPLAMLLLSAVLCVYVYRMPESVADPLPVLMYHHMVPDGQDCNDMTVTPGKFRADLETVLAMGYTPVLPRELAAGDALPEKPILITFDDGYRSNYDLVYPILREYGVKACISIIVLIGIAVFILIRSQVMYKKRKAKEQGNETLKQLMQTTDSEEALQLMRKHTREELGKVLEYAETNFELTVTSFLHENLRGLRRAMGSTKFEKQLVKQMKRTGTVAMCRLDNNTVLEKGLYYYQGNDFASELVYSISRLCEPCLEHIDNNFNPLDAIQKGEFSDAAEDITYLIQQCRRKLENNDYNNMEEEIRRANDLNGQLSLLKRKELQRIQSQSGSIRVSMVYLTMVQEAQNVVTYTINLMKVSRKFQIETD